MMTSGISTDHQLRPPAGDASLARSLEDIEERLRAMHDVIQALEPLVALAQQAPALAAVVGDSFDDVMRMAMDNGIDVERGLLNGAGAALRFGATMDAAKVRDLEALLQSGMLDPGVVRIIGELGRALAETAAAAPRPLGAAGLLLALGKPDVRRALGFLVAVAERFGRTLSAPDAAHS
jgi:hypothetical protein